MYLQHFGLSAAPFRITPHPEFFYGGANRGATLQGLVYAIVHGEGIVQVVGEVGSGKTMLCRVLLEKLPAQVDSVYLANPSLAREELLQALAAELAVDVSTAPAGGVIRLLQEGLIARYAAGRQVVVLIDEAHAMPATSLEEIRLLSNLEHGHHKLLQIVLFAQPELEQTLGQDGMRQLRERITHTFALAALRRADVADYLLFRLRAAGLREQNCFSPAAVRWIAFASEGLTRRINILADKALLAAYAHDRRTVSAADARAAIRDSGFRALRWRRGRRIGGRLLVAAALLGTGGALGVVLRPLSVAPSVLQAPAPARAVSPSESAVSAPGLLGRYLAAGKTRLATAAPEQHCLQLTTAASSERQALEHSLRRLARLLPEQEILVYPTQLAGRPAYGVLLGVFADRTAVKRVQRALPPELKTLQPRPRTIARLREEMARGS